jgi:hypothetical protein
MADIAQKFGVGTSTIRRELSRAVADRVRNGADQLDGAAAAE